MPFVLKILYATYAPLFEAEGQHFDTWQPFVNALRMFAINLMSCHIPHVSIV